MLIAKATIIAAIGFVPVGAIQSISAQAPAPVKVADSAESQAVAKADQAQIIFLDKKAARAQIVNDKLEPYFDRLQTMEMTAKTGSAITGITLKDQQAECRRRYQAAVLTFTDADKEAIRWYIGRLHPVLTRDYPRLAALPWSFIKAADTIEGSLPHTRDMHIVFSERKCKEIMRLRQLSIKDKAHLPILEILVHEQIHVYQRANPGVFDSLYKDIWGFEKVEGITGCDWLTKHQLVNPDGSDATWIMALKQAKASEPGQRKPRKRKKTYLWPLVAFVEGDQIKRMPEDLYMFGVDLDRTKRGFAVRLDAQGKPVARGLTSVTEYRSKFPSGLSVYHPHEISADILSHLLLIDTFAPQAGVSQELKQSDRMQYATARDWFRANLAGPVDKAVVKAKAQAVAGRPVGRGFAGDPRKDKEFEGGLKTDQQRNFGGLSDRVPVRPHAGADDARAHGERARRVGRIGRNNPSGIGGYTPSQVPGSVSEEERARLWESIEQLREIIDRKERVLFRGYSKRRGLTSQDEGFTAKELRLIIESIEKQEIEAAARAYGTGKSDKNSQKSGGSSQRYRVKDLNRILDNAMKVRSSKSKSGGGKTKSK